MSKYAEVRRFCIKKLAHILYECVACSHADREKFDWKMAEQFINENKAIVDSIYDCFQGATTMLPERQVQDFEFFNRVCGRAVWDGLYQPLRTILDLPSRPMPHYTHIHFS